MNGRASNVILAVVVLGLLIPAGRAQATDYFWTGESPPGQLEVPGSDADWSTNATNRVIPASGSVYFATSNSEDPSRSKSYTLTLTPNYNLLSSNYARGYYAGGTSGVNAATRTDVHDAGRNEMRVYATWSTQPAWEVVRIDNNDPSSSKTVSMSGASICVTFSFPPHPSMPPMIRIGGEFGSEPSGPLFPTIDIHECGSPGVDLLGAPTFTAPPETGNWTYEFVSEDPYGNPIPTGIRWTSDGPGLAPGDLFEMEFSVDGEAATTYFCYACEAGPKGACRVFWLDARLAGIPTVSEWGLVVITALLITAGIVIVARRRKRGHSTFCP